MLFSPGIAVSNFAASGPAEFPHFDSHVLALIALMGLPSSYKVTQCNILSKAGSGRLMLDSIKADLLNEERLLARESKTSDRATNALQIHRANDRTHRNKPRTPEEKARFAEWVKTAQCRLCKQVGHI